MYNVRRKNFLALVFFPLSEFIRCTYLTRAHVLFQGFSKLSNDWQKSTTDDLDGGHCKIIVVRNPTWHYNLHCGPFRKDRILVMVWVTNEGLCLKKLSLFIQWEWLPRPFNKLKIKLYIFSFVHFADSCASVNISKN